MSDETNQYYDLTRVVPPTATANPDSIVGGSETQDFPDCCAVGDATGYFCSGTLIAPRLVVTARHCENVRRVFLLGSNIDAPEEGETITVAREIRHPSVDLRLLLLEHDSTVAPRHVAQGFEISAGIQAHGAQAVVAGFGTIDRHGHQGYGLKRKTEVPLMTLDCNGEGESALYGCRPGIELVAGQRGLIRDTCLGDSGGPLYLLSENGEYMLLGVTSRGVRRMQRGDPECGDGGVYIRLDQFIDWIEAETALKLASA